MCNESNKRRELKGAEEIFEAIAANHFLNLVKIINLYTTKKFKKFQIW